MSQTESKSDEHAHLCAVRHVGISLYFVAACVLMVYLNWRDLEKPYHKLSNYYLFWMLICILVICQSFGTFRCFRERFILSLGLVVLLRAAVFCIAPNILIQFATPVRHGFLFMWIVGLLMSLSMFTSAAFKPKPVS
jgi:hypothetical protein